MLAQLVTRLNDVVRLSVNVVVSEYWLDQKLAVCIQHVTRQRAYRAWMVSGCNSGARSIGIRAEPWYSDQDSQQDIMAAICPWTPVILRQWALARGVKPRQKCPAEPIKAFQKTDYSPGLLMRGFALIAISGSATFRTIRHDRASD